MANAEALEGGGVPTPDRPRFTLADIRNQLETGGVVSLVGELAVLHPRGLPGSLTVRRDFYVDPKNPPQIPELSDEQVETLNAAAYFKRQPTRVLSAIPRHFAEDYNHILQAMLPPDRFPGWTVAYGFVSNLASSRVMLGYRMYKLNEPVGQITQHTEVEVSDPDLQKQLRLIQMDTPHTHRGTIGVDVRVRLFPPSLGTRTYLYEKGFYVDGNVKEWKEPVYKGRYISDSALSPEQLQAVARGEQPYPEVEYLPQTEFSGDSRQLMELLVRRAIHRDSTHDLMFREYLHTGVGIPMVDNPSPQLQRLLKEHDERGRELGITKLAEGDFDENHPLMAKYPSRKSRKDNWFPGLTPGQEGTLLRIAEEEWEKRED